MLGIILKAPSEYRNYRRIIRQGKEGFDRRGKCRKVKERENTIKYKYIIYIHTYLCNFNSVIDLNSVIVLISQIQH